MDEFGEAEAGAAARWVVEELERRLTAEGVRFRGYPGWSLHVETQARELTDHLLSLDRRGARVTVPVYVLGAVSIQLAPGLAVVCVRDGTAAGGDPVQVYPPAAAAAEPEPASWRDRPPLL